MSKGADQRASTSSARTAPRYLRVGLIIGLALGTAALLAGCSESAPEVKGDAARGETVHKVCLDCHGTELYASPERKIKSLKSLRLEVARWGDYYSPALTPQDNEDVVVYLNTQFYKF